MCFIAKTLMGRGRYYKRNYLEIFNTKDAKIGTVVFPGGFLSHQEVPPLPVGFYGK